MIIEVMRMMRVMRVMEVMEETEEMRTYATVGLKYRSIAFCIDVIDVVCVDASPML